MSGRVLNRVEELLARKRREEGKRPSYRDIAEVTGLSKTTVGKWSRNEIDNFSGDILAAFCEYFDCDVGDLLYYDREV